jgi:hypothetical protein
MDINQIKDWLVPISSFIALITVSISAWLSLKEYRIKLKAEARLSRSAQVEADVRLLKVFTEIMDIAHARRGSIVSEKSIEEMFDKGILTKDDFDDLKKLNEKIETVSVLNLPVGRSAQEAAIAAIATLVKRHPDVLKEPGIVGLQSLRGWLKPDKVPAARKYLEPQYLSELESCE